ncbi:MAG: hypothetical protein ACC634_01885 [Hyphomicrobiales bacterium]
MRVPAWALILVAWMAIATPLAAQQTTQASAPPVEFTSPDTVLVTLAELIRTKQMDKFFVQISQAANLGHPVKNLPPDEVRRLGQNLQSLFLPEEKVEYVDRIVDERYGTSLRKVVYMAYTSRDIWVYFTFVLKRGGRGWQFTKFSYAVDRFDLFPPEQPR